MVLLQQERIPHIDCDTLKCSSGSICWVIMWDKKIQRFFHIRLMNFSSSETYLKFSSSVAQQNHTYAGRSSKIKAVVESGSNSIFLRLADDGGGGLYILPVRALYS